MIFSQAESEHSQLIARIDGIDGNFLFGNSAATGLALGPSPFLLHLGGTNVSQGLALLYIMSNNMYLGFDTSLVSSGASPVTFTSGGGGKKMLFACATGKQLLIPFKGVI